jgi:hypothetical protein
LINVYDDDDDDDAGLHNPKPFLCLLMMILNPSFCTSILWFFGDDIPYVPNKKGNNNISHYHYDYHHHYHHHTS